MGELRRHLLDRVRVDDLSRCEEVLRGMDDIYGVLVTMDYPNALTGGLRRSTDVARSIIEKTAATSPWPCASSSAPSPTSRRRSRARAHSET